ncbi:MAG: hypothetical protein MJY44_04820 [Bacteroidales bacterium]|nr:hypothetical protein [Bacteroidales bacterium]
MKRLEIFAAALAGALLVTVSASAQDERLAPGIYAVVDGTPTHLTYTPAVNVKSGINVIGVEVGNSRFDYKGETSGVTATGKFIMVIDPERKVLRKTPKIYDPFVKTMTPDLIMIVPLEVVKGKRVYDRGVSVQGIDTRKHNRMEFQWELVDENTFEITAALLPGEYAFVFKPAKMGSYDFSSIYGFTCPQPEKELE